MLITKALKNRKRNVPSAMLLDAKQKKRAKLERVTAKTWLAAFVIAAVAATARGGLTADEVQGSIGLGFSLATWRAVYAEEWWL